MNLEQLPSVGGAEHRNILTEEIILRTLHEVTSRLPDLNEIPAVSQMIDGPWAYSRSEGERNALREYYPDLVSRSLNFDK